MSIKCKSCGTDKYIKNGFSQGKQRYRGARNGIVS